MLSAFAEERDEPLECMISRAYPGRARKSLIQRRLCVDCSQVSVSWRIYALSTLASNISSHCADIFSAEQSFACCHSTSSTRNHARLSGHDTHQVASMTSASPRRTQCTPRVFEPYTARLQDRLASARLQPCEVRHTMRDDSEPRRPRPSRTARAIPQGRRTSSR